MNRSPIDWLDWNDRAFALARDERRPVLLAIHAAWCAACRHMCETVWRDAAIVALVRDRFVPVRVDCDRHPDISDRYSLGGWPTTVFLTPEGEVLGGGTILTVGRLRPLLADVAEAFASRRLEIEELSAAAARHRSAARPAPAPPDADDVRRAAGGVLDALASADDAGAVALAAHDDVLHLAVARAARPDGDAWAAALAPVLETLAIRLYDPVDGGFFRAPAGGGAAAPGTEKLLSHNARLLRVWLRAWRELEWPFCREAALGVLRWTHAVLADRDGGGFFASQAAGAPYYAGDAPRAGPAPAVDRTMYVDANALMISAYLDAAETLGDSSLAELAVASLERVVPEAYRPGAGVAHAIAGGEVRGLLADQVLASRALLDAEAPTGRRFYGELAQELMEYALRTMWDEAAGGFRDRAQERTAIGLLREPLHPAALNGEAARVLVALAASSGENRFVELAGRTVAAAAAAAGGRALEAAAWVRAHDAVRAWPRHA